MAEHVDIAMVGAGAAGLMAGIWAGRARPGRRVVLLDGARKIGAKVLVAGGGRCNVTHDHVDERAFAGSTPPAIRRILRRFDVPATIAFFAGLGVSLKREETGKLFPTTDRAQTVLDALLAALRDARVELRHPCRVDSVRHDDGGFSITGGWGQLTASHVILATGGMSLPKTGSDGHGYEIARQLGHTLTPRILPGLVPLTLPDGHFLRQLSGLTAPATLELRAATGRRIISFTDSTLCTHFGLSGPSVLDISRHYLHAVLDDPESQLLINWLPDHTAQSLDAAMLASQNLGPARLLRDMGLPDRLARAICIQTGIDEHVALHQVPRDRRKALAQAVVAMPLPMTGDRGFTFAEVTAGGVPLRELRLDTLESRVRRGLHLCGEICDVDGRIGGYNFQWAWASGYVAGCAVGADP